MTATRTTEQSNRNAALSLEALRRAPEILRNLEAGEGKS